MILSVGRFSVVGIVTFYGLNGPEFEPWWGRNFLYPFSLALRPTQPPA